MEITCTHPAGSGVLVGAARAVRGSAGLLLSLPSLWERFRAGATESLLPASSLSGTLRVPGCAGNLGERLRAVLGSAAL